MSATVARCLADLIYRHGVPTLLIHDLGSEFFRCITRHRFYSRDQTASYITRTSTVQRLSRMVQPYTESYAVNVVANKGHDWDKLPEPLLFAY